MQISELVKRSGLPRAVIDHYERSGLLPQAERTSGNYRIYSEEHVNLLDFIRQCRSHAIPLDEVRELLRIKDKAQMSDEQLVMLDRHLQSIRKKIAELEELSNLLVGLRAITCSPRS